MLTNDGNRPFHVIRLYGMIVAARPPFIRETREMRRTESPVAAGLPGYGVQVEVRHFLAAAGAVVLIHQDSVRLEGVDHCTGDPFGRRHDGSLLGVFQVQQCRRVTPGNDDALADFELAAIQKG
jgi:hypothetical protein